VNGDLGNLQVNQYWLRDKDRYKAEVELTAFGAIDFGNTTFNHPFHIQDTRLLLKEVGKEFGGKNLYR